MRLAKPRVARRPGFTLIELLVVIAIIGILASLIVGATMRVIGVQAQKNTEMLVQKVSDAVTGMWFATVEEANREPINVPPGIDPRVARANYINARLAQQFPMSYQEALNPGITPDPSYAAALAHANPGDPQQSGVLLWLMLKNSRNGAIFNQDIFTPREAIPSSIPNVLCLVDDWKNPLQFQRALYQNVYPNGAKQVPFDLPLNMYYVPVVWSNGGPAGVAIYSYQVRIGGFSGGS